MNPGTSPSAANLHGVARAGRLADSVLIAVRRHAAPGHAVGDLDRLASELLARHGADSAMLGHEDGFGGGRFPASIAVCINDEIMGASGPDRVLNPGDLITADLAVRCRGWHADAARTWTLPGPTPPEHARLAKAARAACVAGVRAARPGVPWSAITDAISAVTP